MIKYGKYKGQSESKIINIDPRYALWAHKNVWWFNLNPRQIEEAVENYEILLNAKEKTTPQHHTFDEFMDADIPF